MSVSTKYGKELAFGSSQRKLWLRGSRGIFHPLAYLHLRSRSRKLRESEERRKWDYADQDLPIILPAEVLFFLDAALHLYKRSCPSVHRSVRRSVGWSVRPSVTRFFFFAKNDLKMARTDQETFCKAWIRSQSNNSAHQKIPVHQNIQW